MGIREHSPGQASSEQRSAAAAPPGSRRRLGWPRWSAVGLSLAIFTSIASVAAAPQALAGSVLCTGDSYSTCVNAGFTDHGYAAHSGTSYWGADPGHNCTNYVAYVETQNGVARPSFALHDAWQWWSEA